MKKFLEARASWAASSPLALTSLFSFFVFFYQFFFFQFNPSQLNLYLLSINPLLGFFFGYHYSLQKINQNKLSFSILSQSKNKNKLKDKKRKIIFPIIINCVLVHISIKFALFFNVHVISYLGTIRNPNLKLRINYIIIWIARSIYHNYISLASAGMGFMLF